MLNSIKYTYNCFSGIIATIEIIATKIAASTGHSHGIS